MRTRSFGTKTLASRIGRQSERASRAAGIVLALAALTTGAFFVSFWGRNASWLGRRDMGVALALSFAVPLTVYVSAALAAVSAVGAIHAGIRHRPARRWVASLGLAILPIVVLYALDPRL